MRIVLLTRMEELTVDADQVLEGKTNIQMLFAQVSQIHILIRTVVVVIESEKMVGGFFTHRYGDRIAFTSTVLMTKTIIHTF